MPETQDLGSLQHISADAVGQPGQRRFRLRLITKSVEYAYIWLEKEQLVALSEAIDTVLEEYSSGSVVGNPDDPVFPLDVNLEIDSRSGNLSLGLNKTDELIILVAVGISGEEAFSLSIQFDYVLAKELCAQIEILVAAGRQPCQLCGGPIDPEGHVCPRSNGFHEIDPN